MASKGSISRERRERAAQLALAQKKKERTAIIISISAIVALMLIACVAGVVIYQITNRTIPHLADDAYVTTDEVTNFVKLNISYKDKDGVKRNDDIVVELDAENAPITVANFQKLVSEGFYDGLIFHRIIESFMIQGGCPNGNGTGGADKDIKGEFSANGVDNPIKHVRGTISMAREGERKDSAGNVISTGYDTASSQFFIVHQTSTNNTKSLDGNYAAFGHVVFGMETVDRIAELETDSNDQPISDVVINFATFVTAK